MEHSNSDPRDPNYYSESGTDEWVTEEDIQALQDERDILGDDEVQQAERILKENLPAVVHSVAKMARSAQSETVRLNAAKYIIDRNLGKITEPKVEEDDALRELYQDVTVTK